MDRYDRLAAEYQDHLRARNLVPDYVAHRGKILEAFRRFLARRGVREMDDITEEDGRQYIIHLQTTPIRRGFGSREGRLRASATVRGTFCGLAKFFRYLLRHNRILADPFARLESPRQESRLPRTVLTEAEMIRLLLAPDTETARGIRDRALLEVAYSSGLRRCELAGLDVRDVDLARGRLFIRRGKPRKDRVVPIGKPARAWLTRYLTEARPRLHPPAGEPALFVSERGRLCGEMFNEIVRRCARRARIERRLGCHALRHTCATHFLAGGADIRHIQELLGHESPDTTAVYARVFPKDLKAAVAAALGKRDKAVAPPPAA